MVSVNRFKIIDKNLGREDTGMTYLTNKTAAIFN